MEIEGIKTWQWVLVGLLAGGLFSCLYAWSGPRFDSQDRDTVEQGEFENNCFALTKFGQNFGLSAALINDFHKDLPLVRDVTVHPPIAGDPKHYWVTGRYYSIESKPVDTTKMNGPSKVWEEWKLFKFPAVVPYEPGYTLREEKKLNYASAARRNAQLAELKKELGGQSSFPTVVEYLKAVQKLPGNDFKFQYAWWELPVPKWTLPPLAGLLIIGVAWPITLGAMQTYGLAKPPPKPKPAPAKKPVRSTTAMPAGVILKPVAPPPPPKPVDEKKYGGEFYPVVKTTHKD